MSGAVPKLRFPGFAGEWKPTAVSALTDRVALPVEVDPSETYREIGVRSHGKGIFHKEEAPGSVLGEKRVFAVVPDALVLNIVFAWEQAVAVTTQADAGFIASHRFPMFRPKPGKADLAFLYRFFMTKKGKALLELASPGGAGRNKTLGQQEFLKLKTPAPTLPEQEKIAGFLGAVDGKISGLRRKEEGVKRFKAGLMQKLFSQELRFTCDDGSEFPEWEEKRLADLAHRPGEQFDPQREASRPKVVELEHLESGTGRILAAVEMDAQLSLKNRFRPGDVLFGKLRPYLRKFARPDFDGVCSSEIWVLRSRGEVSSAFLYLLVQSERFLEAANMSSGSKMPRAEWNAVANVEFPVPHPDEQRKIAEALSALDGKIAGVRAQIAGLESFKKGLLQQMFV